MLHFVTEPRHILHSSRFYGVPNMNKITIFFPGILQQIHKIYNKNCDNGAKLCFTCMSGPWSLIMAPNRKKIQPAI